MHLKLIVELVKGENKEMSLGQNLANFFLNK